MGIERIYARFRYYNHAKYKYHNRERLMLFSHNLDELPPAEEGFLCISKLTFKDLQRAEQEITNGSETVVVTYYTRSRLYR